MRERAGEDAAARRRAWLACVLALLVGAAGCVGVAGCRAPLRGESYGAGRDAFLHRDYAAPGTWSDAPLQRLILIGDSGRPSPDDPTLALLGRWGDAQPERTTVVFLGDNLYPAGLEPSDRARGEAVLLQQLEATRARKILIPGNHDWGFTGFQRMGAGVLANQQAFVESRAHLRADFLPRDGCPGPVPVELAPADGPLAGGLLLIVLDLHWWLLREDERGACDGVADTADFIERLRAALDAGRDHNVVVVAHHPIRSGGTHGGFTRGFWTDIGVSIFYRFYTVQDLIEPDYAEMVSVLSEVLAESPPLVVAGGHDHNLQVLDGGDAAGLILVSGAGSQVTGVTSIEGTLFAHAHRGFQVLDFHSVPGRREAVLALHVVETGREDPVFSLDVDIDHEPPAPQPGAAP